MKKILSLCMGAILALSLSSCSGKATIEIPNEEGSMESVEISATSDPKLLADAIEFAGTATFDDVKSFVLKSNVSFDLKQNDTNDANGKLSCELQASQLGNLYADLSLSIKTKIDNEKEQNKLNGNLYLENLEDNPFAYIGYEFKNDSKEEKKKTKISFETIKMLIGSFIEGIAPQIPELPDIPGLPEIPSITDSSLVALADDSNDLPEVSKPNLSDASMAIKEFFSRCPNSKLAIEHVKSQSFDLALKLSLKDMIKVSCEESNSELPELPKGDAYISLSYKLDTKNARPLAFDFEIGGKELTPYLEMLLKDDNLELKDPSAKISFHTEIKYSTKPEIKMLSENDKSSYKEFELPVLPF